jgi:hypothetical protein
VKQSAAERARASGQFFEASFTAIKMRGGRFACDNVLSGKNLRRRALEIHLSAKPLSSPIGR